MRYEIVDGILYPVAKSLQEVKEVCPKNEAAGGAVWCGSGNEKRKSPSVGVGWGNNLRENAFAL